MRAQLTSQQLRWQMEAQEHREKQQRIMTRAATAALLGQVDLCRYELRALYDHMYLHTDAATEQRLRAASVALVHRFRRDLDTQFNATVEFFLQRVAGGSVEEPRADIFELITFTVPGSRAKVVTPLYFEAQEIERQNAVRQADIETAKLDGKAA